jgi:hypothetical protein
LAVCKSNNAHQEVIFLVVTVIIVPVWQLPAAVLVGVLSTILLVCALLLLACRALGLLGPYLAC